MPILDNTTMIYALLGLVLILALWIFRLEMRMKNLSSGKDGKSLEDSIILIRKGLEELNHFRDESIEYLKLIEVRLKRSIQSVETIRFNPFKGTGDGGNQSFSTTLLNEKGDGVVISSLHARDHVSIFSKPIKKFQSEFEMTQEEKKVVGKARENLTQIQKLS
jgi:hypothetical protein